MASSQRRKNPRKRQKEALPQFYEALTGKPPQRKILVVDSNQEIRDILTEYLTGEGYTVLTTGGPRDVKEMLENEKYDLIITELIFEGEDGLTMIGRLRGDGIDIPIICLTGRGETVDRIIGLEIGADDYLPKPFHLRELLAKIKAVLRNRTSAVAIKPTIKRIITFRPEYYQAGLQILSYFSRIIQQKYPQTAITVSIQQSGNTVSLLIETEDGSQELVERTLDDYAEVVFGRKKPESLLDDPIAIMELKYKIDLAEAELRVHRQLHLHSKEQYDSRVQSLENQVSMLHRTLYLGMSRERKLLQLLAQLTESVPDAKTRGALQTLATRLTMGVTEADEAEVKAAISTIREDKSVFGHVLRICRDLVSHGGSHLISEWILGAARALPH